MAPVKAEVWSLYAQFHLSSTDREEQLKVLYYHFNKIKEIFLICCTHLVVSK